MEGQKTGGSNTVAEKQNAISFLQEIDRGLHDFLHWQKGLYRSLISDGVIDPNDLAPDSHRRCAFGHWLAQLPERVRARDVALEEIAAIHQRMHTTARVLLAAHQLRQPITSTQFDAFVELAQDFKLALLKYQRGIINDVCTLDPLTGAGNRYAMDLRLTEEWERTRRTGQPCSLCLLDIDHFKRINDEHGHTVGDTALRVISRYLKGEGRAYDELFRYGGEEFLICMPNIALDQADIAVNRLREGLATLCIPLEGGASLSLTASFGVALLLPDEPIGLSVERADHALLCAKNRGRNRICVWDMSIRQELAKLP